MNARTRYNQQPDLGWIENIARIMDSKFKIPGTGFRFGLDPIIGLIPVLGGATTAAISGALIISMLRYGVSRKVVYLMLLNTGLDVVIGSIPILGWIFDFTYKANNRNIRLLKEHYHEGKHSGSGTGILVTVVLVLLVLIVFVIWGLVALIQWLWGLF